jgi:hypothetical protein
MFVEVSSLTYHSPITIGISLRAWSVYFGESEMPDREEYGAEDRARRFLTYIECVVRREVSRHRCSSEHKGRSFQSHDGRESLGAQH